MKEFYCENQGGYTYLVYEASSGEIIDRLGLGMMTNNEIRGFLPLIYTQMDGKSRFKYNISAKVSLSQYMTGTLNRHKLLTIFRTIVEAVLNAEEYLIDSESILFDPECIYVDVTTSEVEMICLPLEGMEQKDLGNFFKSIMYNMNIKYDASENCDYVVKIHNFLNASPTFSLGDFNILLHELILNDTPQKNSDGKMPVAGVPEKEIDFISVKTVNEFESKERLAEDIDKGIEINDKKTTQKQIITDIKNDTKSNPGKQQQRDIMETPFEIPGYSPAVEDDEKDTKKRFLFFGGSTKKEEKKKRKKEKKEKKTGILGKKKEDEKIWDESLGTPVCELFDFSEKMFVDQNNQLHRNPKDQNMDLSSEQVEINFGATTFFDEEKENGTVCLDETKDTVSSKVIKARLIRNKNNQVILINNNPFKIGRSRDYADYYIDNQVIGRSHAMIMQRGTDFYIVDTNSKNHTYVDGKMIASNSEIPIGHKTKIRLANEEFVFELF